jgi:hypothetical protein
MNTLYKFVTITITILGIIHRPVLCMNKIRRLNSVLVVIWKLLSQAQYTELVSVCGDMCYLKTEKQ